MASDIALSSGSLSTKQAILEITRQNELTVSHGLLLTERQAMELLETRSCSLKDTGRLEFGAGAIGRLIQEFSSSPYVSPDNYLETLHELIEIFYYFKNETLDLISDDNLIRFMKKCFDGRCGGSLEILRSRDLEEMARSIRSRVGGSVDGREGWRTESLAATRDQERSAENGPFNSGPGVVAQGGADGAALSQSRENCEFGDASASVEAAMRPVNRPSRITKTALSAEFYLRSLLTEAYCQGELDAPQMEAILMQCLSVLAAGVERLNKGKSSSVKWEAAQTLAESIFYTMGLYLKGQPEVSLAVQTLKIEPLSEIYRKGRHVLDSQLAFARGLYELVRMTKVSTPDYAYVETIDRGIEDFFRCYDPDFAAHEVPGSIDYQLLNPVMGLAGVEYMIRYLQSLYLENQFCSAFDAAVIDEVMRNYYFEYEDLLDNICGQVLRNALGCAILGESVLSLRLSRVDVQRLKGVLAHKDREYTRDILKWALETALDRLSLKSAPLKAYLTASLTELMSRISTAKDTGRLDKIFVPSQIP
ncbi:MAG: DUF6323 family protein [Bacillota bacterium]